MNAPAIPVAEPIRPIRAILLGEAADAVVFQRPAADLVPVFSSCAVFDPANWNADAQCDPDVLPVVLLDATQGVRELDRVHGYIARFFPRSSPLVLVGRMNEIGFEQEQYELIVEEYLDFLGTIGTTSAINLPAPLNHLAQIDWYEGPTLETVIADLQRVVTPVSTPLRIRAKSVLSDNGHWHLDGDLVSGEVAVGDTVLSSPSNRTAIVSAVRREPEEIEKAPGQRKIGLTFQDAFFADPGEILSHKTAAPIETDVFRAHVKWSGSSAMAGERLRCETAYGSFGVTIQSIDHVFDPVAGRFLPDNQLDPGCFGEIVLRADTIVAVDSLRDVPAGAHFHLADASGEIQCSGLVSMEGYADQRHLRTAKATNITPVKFALTEKDRADRNGHSGGVLWFTGLSGSGKSTLAMALEARLFEEGFQVYVMDGDNVRQGLTSNLGFSPDDRAENIRRVGEVAALFRQAGMIVISSFISPYRSDRDRARHAAQSGFHEVFIKAKVETCIARDPKGLYERALRGDIRDFTGISAPYEEPAAADLVIDTEQEGVDACVDRLVKYVDKNFRIQSAPT